MSSVAEQQLQDSPFSAVLKASTWEDHERAEYAGYMQAMLGGELSRAAYAEMVAQHFFAYQILEDAAGTMRADPVAREFIFDELTRIPALEADLAFLLGADWRDRIRPNRATEEYRERLREVCFTWPGGFVAHSYTRYLGDLSGGQAIRVAVQRAYQFDDERGIQFYRFPEIPNFREFKELYRQRLDTAPWDSAEKSRIIDEALLAYRFNTAVLVELGNDVSR